MKKLGVGAALILGTGALASYSYVRDAVHISSETGAPVARSLGRVSGRGGLTLQEFRRQFVIPDASLAELSFSVFSGGSEILEAKEATLLAYRLSEEPRSLMKEIFTKASADEVRLILKIGVELGRYPPGTENMRFDGDVDALLKDLERLNITDEEETSWCGGAGCYLHVQPSQPSRWATLTLSGIAGAGSILISHPADTLRVRMALSKSSDSTSSLATLKRLVRKEGVLTLMRGVMPEVLSCAGATAVAFFSAREFHRVFNRTEQGEVMPLGTMFAIGAAAGVSVSPIATSLELVKIISQKTGQPWLGAAGDILRRRGIRGLFAGFGVTTLRLIPGWGVYLAAQEALIRQIQPECAQISLGPGRVADKPVAARFSSLILSGGIAGCAAWIASLPLDVLKSKIQMAPDKGYVYHARSMTNLRSMYTGIAPTLARAFIANAALWIIHGSLFPLYKEFLYGSEAPLMHEDSCADRMFFL